MEELQDLESTEIPTYHRLPKEVAKDAGLRKPELLSGNTIHDWEQRCESHLQSAPFCVLLVKLRNLSELVSSFSK